MIRWLKQRWWELLIVGVVGLITLGVIVALGGCQSGFRIPSWLGGLPGTGSDPTTGEGVTYMIFAKLAWWMLIPGVMLVLAGLVLKLPTATAGWYMVGIGAGAAIVPMVLASTWGTVILMVCVALMAGIGIWKALQITGLLEKRKACQHVLDNTNTEAAKVTAKADLTRLESKLGLNKWPDILKRKVAI